MRPFALPGRVSPPTPAPPPPTGRLLEREAVVERVPGIVQDVNHVRLEAEREASWASVAATRSIARRPRTPAAPRPTRDAVVTTRGGHTGHRRAVAGSRERLRIRIVETEIVGRREVVRRQVRGAHTASRLHDADHHTRAERRRPRGTHIRPADLNRPVFQVPLVSRSGSPGHRRWRRSTPHVQAHVTIAAMRLITHRYAEPCDSWADRGRRRCEALGQCHQFQSVFVAVALRRPHEPYHRNWHEGDTDL